ncbi:ABC transporter permease [Psychromicrobium xiongbiense]|uniref:ABC transporter permease n=1 Tax=Psychromicrobium xiongbiense TaxID=3051184 RepID=UPI002553F8BF|nr:iron ABC transporter permease [Psychromicrobium sp. YIM S02556]
MRAAFAHPGRIAIVILAVLVSALSLLPLGFVVVGTVSTGWDTAVAMVLRPRVGELLSNTLLLILITVPLCLMIGTGGAWLVEKSHLAGRRWWAVLLAAPLAIPAFVNSYAWVSAIPSLSGLSSGVLVATLSYYPFVYLPVAAALSRMDPALEETAAVLGHGPWRRFFTVVLPQCKLSLLGGGLLVGLHLLSEYGAFAFIRFDTFTTAIYEQYQSTFNSSAATMLAGVLVLLCLVLLLAEGGLRGKARYARLGTGSQAAPSREPLGVWQLPAQLLLAALATAAFALPLWQVLRWVVAGGAEVWARPELVNSLGTTLGYGVAGAVVTVLASLPLSYLSVRRPGMVSKLLEGLNYVSSSMPGIVLALALVAVTIRAVPGLYQTSSVLLVGYLLLFIPRALVTVRTGLAQAPPQLEEAAQSLGRRPFAAFWLVTARLSAPAVASAAALVFLGVVNELTATLLLAPNGTRTLASEFWSLSSEIDYAGAAPYALLMVLLSAPVTYLLFVQSKKVAGQ